MLNVNYNFYHHLNPDFPKDRIIQLIQNKDYKGFMEQYYKFIGIPSRKKQNRKS